VDLGHPALPVGAAERRIAADPEAGRFGEREADIGDEVYHVATVALGGGRGAVQSPRSSARPRTCSPALQQRTALLAASVIALARGRRLVAGAPDHRPRLVRLTAVAETVAEHGRLDVPVPVAGARRGRQARPGLRRHAGRLANSVQDQQRLVQDAGHELRTPLTSLRTNISLLKRFEELPPEGPARNCWPTWPGRPANSPIWSMSWSISRPASGTTTRWPKSAWPMSRRRRRASARRRTGREDHRTDRAPGGGRGPADRAAPGRSPTCWRTPPSSTRVAPSRSRSSSPEPASRSWTAARASRRRISPGCSIASTAPRPHAACPAPASASPSSARSPPPTEAMPSPPTAGRRRHPRFHGGDEGGDAGGNGEGRGEGLRGRAAAGPGGPGRPGGPGGASGTGPVARRGERDRPGGPSARTPASPERRRVPALSALPVPGPIPPSRADRPRRPGWWPRRTSRR